MPIYKLEDLASMLSLSNIDVAKIDVEGAEINVLRGSSTLLRKCAIKRLVIEVHLDCTKIAEVTKLLSKRI